MPKKKEIGKCKECEHYSSFNSTCLSSKGAFYKKTGFNASAESCDKFKKPKTKKYELKEDDFISNPWLEWKKRNMIYEKE